MASRLLGRRRWGDERRGPGRSKEDMRRELDRETQDRTVQPVVSAEELADRRHRKHTMAAVGHLRDAIEQGDNKRRRTEVVSSEDVVRP